MTTRLRPRPAAAVIPDAVAERLPAEPIPAPARAPARRRQADGRRVRQLREVLREVESLRGVLHQAVEAYERRTSAQLVEILRALYGDAGPLDRIPPAKTTSAMLRAIQAVELKPGRGRAKDLVRLHELVAELTELLTPRS